MLQGVHPIFIVPWIVLLAVAVGIGLWSGRRHGAGRAFTAAAISFVIGFVVLVLLFIALIIFYYANGGH